MTVVSLNSKAGSVQTAVHDPTEHLQKWWLKGAFYEGSMLEWIHRHYKGGTFIDCGSSIGNHTLYFAAFCADRVVSVEPVASSFDHQRENLQLNKLDNKVLMVNAALSSKSGRGHMVSFAPSGHNNVGMWKLEAGNDIEVTTLDDLAILYGLNDVTLIKIDVEYHELEVLRGAEWLLKRQHPALFIELSPKDTYYKDAVEFLKRLGYVQRSEHNQSPTYEFVYLGNKPPAEKRSLHILQVGEWDFAGCGYFLAQAINETTPHKARSIVYKPAATLAFPTDLVAPSAAQVRDLWQWADIIHVHDGTQSLPKNLPSRPTVITWHGTYYRRAPEKANQDARAKGWVTTCATLDLTLLGPQWLPDCRPDLSTYVNRLEDSFIVAHANLRGTKGLDIVVTGAQGFDLDIIKGIPWKEALKRRGQAAVTIDQFTLGYGCSAIEAWLMGQPVIAGAPPRILNRIRQEVGELPFIACANAEDVQAALVQLRDDSAYYAEWANRGHAYALQYHSYEAVAKRALAFYTQALRNSMPGIKGKTSPRLMPVPKPIAVGAEGMVKIRYIGKNWGGELVTGAATGTRYKFTREKPIRYMDKYDADALLAWDAGTRKSGRYKGKRNFVLEE